MVSDREEETVSPVRRAPLRVVLAALVAACLSALTIAPAHAAAYRYWGFYQLSDGAWTFAQKGPDQTVPKDGSVEGWRFAVADEASTRYPRAVLTFGLVRRNVIRLVQTYTTPKDIRLTKPTLFYVGMAGKRFAPLAAKTKTKPILKKGKRVKGRFRATTQVRIPKAWKGRFRYASCFPYNAGMGNPKLGCPKKKYKF